MIEDIRAYSTLKGSYTIPEREEDKPKETESPNRIYSYLFNDLPTETDGEIYSSHLKAWHSFYREDFRELVASIVERFIAGEWQQDKEQKIERALTLAIDKELALQAMAIDAFLADATEEEILHFNELALSGLQRKELDSKSKYAPDITAKRGFSNGEHISHGFFTKMPAAI